MSNYNNVPDLSSRVHWRRIKSILRFLSRVESVEMSKYDFNNIRCYECTGIELQGKNVKFITNGNNACFVDDNKYQMFEVSQKNNHHKSFGGYLFLAYNVSFDYWVMGELHIGLNVDKSKNVASTYENIIFKPYGAYVIGDEIEVKSIKKTIIGKSLTYGGKNSKNVLFDSVGNRRKAYKTNEKQIVSKLRGKSNDRDAINKKDKVKIYKNKRY